MHERTRHTTSTPPQYTVGSSERNTHLVRLVFLREDEEHKVFVPHAPAHTGHERPGVLGKDTFDDQFRQRVPTVLEQVVAGEEEVCEDSVR